MITGKKNILNKIFYKKNNESFEKEKNAKNIRLMIYKHILMASGGDNKLMGMRYELLYAEYAKRYSINLSSLAKNRNMKTIEFAEISDKETKSNHIEKLYVLAKELFPFDFTEN